MPLPSAPFCSADSPVPCYGRRLEKHEDGTVCNGLYDSERRHIQIDRTLPPRHRWRVFYHELVHVALLDSGLDNGINDALHEAIADAIATQRLRERRG